MHLFCDTHALAPLGALSVRILTTREVESGNLTCQKLSVSLLLPEVKKTASVGICRCKGPSQGAKVMKKR